MKNWNTAGRSIADTDHSTFIFTGNTMMIIADWQYIEKAPDNDGRVYASVCGWLANTTDGDPRREPVQAGRARLVRADLRGRQPLADLNVHVDYTDQGQPYPNSWDHCGVLATITWMDRRLDLGGDPIEEDEIGRTTWTHPDTGRVFDLRAAYAEAGDRPERGDVWRHFDHWRGGVPLLERFHGTDTTPHHLSIPRLITDGQWTETNTAPVSN